MKIKLIVQSTETTNNNDTINRKVEYTKQIEEASEERNKRMELEAQVLEYLFSDEILPLK
jgi:hypothetical protein